tara:strand:+ start:3048 stop:3563 length:516 start_codon:yes stop_codon:yes gene_type:complete
MNIELSSIMEEIENKETDPKLTKGDLERIASKASYSFLGVLSEQEIESCILNAYWKASSKYTSGRNTKFTTFFYKGVLMECLTQKKFNLNKPTYRIYENIAYKNNEDIERIDMIDEIHAHCDDPDLLFQRFYQNMSVREIASIRGVSGETIRIKIKKNLAKLRSKMTRVSV